GSPAQQGKDIASIQGRASARPRLHNIAIPRQKLMWAALPKDKYRSGAFYQFTMPQANWQAVK
ncbi:MAG: hypothetical protein ACK4ZS_06000, partial [Sulfurimicrobium sp.]